MGISVERNFRSNIYSWRKQIKIVIIKINVFLLSLVCSFAELKFESLFVCRLFWQNAKINLSATFSRSRSAQRLDTDWIMCQHLNASFSGRTWYDAYTTQTWSAWRPMFSAIHSHSLQYVTKCRQTHLWAIIVCNIKRKFCIFYSDVVCFATYFFVGFIENKILKLKKIKQTNRKNETFLHKLVACARSYGLLVCFCFMRARSVSETKIIIWKLFIDKCRNFSLLWTNIANLYGPRA